VVEAGLGDPLEVDGGDDLVGVDVAAAQRDADAGVGGEGFHGGAPGEGGSGDGLEVGGRDGGAEVRRRGQRAAHGGGGGDDGRDQVGAPALALPALEVAVGGRGGPLPRCQLVRVHPQAHGASGLAPLGAEGEEHLVQALLLG